ncbi:MAG TPA: GNAT family N-acetyltransferase, partial [Roseiflexaceae bacterium]|nr:GNAT family N-acetyltransferase [Roseiflexaceae bacterium]
AMFDRPFRLFIDIRERDRPLATLVQQAGFVSHDTFTLYLSRTLDDIIPVPQVPLGYQLRLFAGTGEVDEFVRAHRAAFGAAMMTSAWRERMLQLPEYLPELDVVAASSDGRIAAFCLGWLYPLQRIGQIDPIGVDPAFQHAGLAGAVLLEGLWRLQAHRAAVAQVVVYEEDHAARTLFEAAGFRVDERAVTYMMEFRGHDD